MVPLSSNNAVGAVGANRDVFDVTDDQQPYQHPRVLGRKKSTRVRFNSVDMGQNYDVTKQTGGATAMKEDDDQEYSPIPPGLVNIFENFEKEFF